MLRELPMVTEYDVGSTSSVDILARVSNATSAAKSVALGPQEKRVKCRPMKLFTSKDLTRLYHSYRSKRHKRDLTWITPLSCIALVRVGLPQVVSVSTSGGDSGDASSSSSKTSFLTSVGSLLSRSPKPSLSLTLEGPSGVALLHIEASSPAQLDSLLRTLSILSQYARSRAGFVEAVPEIQQVTVPPPGALLPNSGGGAPF